MATLRRQLGAGEQEAQNLRRRSVEFKPRLFESHYAFGTLALQRRRPAEAIKNRKIAAELQPNRAQV